MVGDHLVKGKVVGGRVVRSYLVGGREVLPLTEGGYNDPYTKSDDEELNTTPNKRVVLPNKDETTLHNKKKNCSSDPTTKQKKLEYPTKGFGKSGTIQARTTACSIIFKNWSNSVWLHVFPATIKLFESEEKMQQWKDASKKERNKKGSKINKLVKFSIDFDTTKKLKHSKRQTKKSGVDGSKSSAFTDLYRPIHYVLEEVRSKYYQRPGPLM